MLTPRTTAPQQAQPKTREDLVNQINEAFEKIAVVRAKAFDAKVDMPSFEKLTFENDFLNAEVQDPQKKTPAVLSSKIQALTTVLASMDNDETKGSFASIGNELKNKLGENVDSLFNRVARGEMNPTDLQKDIQKLMSECNQEISAKIDDQKPADEAKKNFVNAQKQCKDLLDEIEKDALDKELARIARVLESQHAIEWSELQRGLAKNIGGAPNPHPLKRIDKPEAFGDEKKASFLALNQLADGTYSREGGQFNHVVKNGSISPVGRPPITLQSSPTRFEQAWREVIELFSERSPDKIIVFSDHKNPSFDEMKMLLAMAHKRGIMAEVDEGTLSGLTKSQGDELRKIMRANNAELEGKENEIKDNIAKINESTKALQTHNQILGDQKNPPSPQQIEAAITAMQNAFNQHQSHVEKDYVAVEKLTTEMKSLISAIEGKDLGTKANEFEQVKNSLQTIEKQQTSYDAALTMPITLDSEKIKEKIYQAAGKDYQDKGWIEKNVTGAGRHIEEIASLHEGIAAKWREYATQQKDAAKAMTQHGFEVFLQGKMLEGTPANKGLLADAAFSVATAALGSKRVGSVDKFLTDKDAAGIAAVVFAAYANELQPQQAPVQAQQAQQGGNQVQGSGVSMEEQAKDSSPLAVTRHNDQSDPELSTTEPSVGAIHPYLDDPASQNVAENSGVSKEEMENKYESVEESDSKSDDNADNDNERVKPRH